MVPGGWKGTGAAAGGRRRRRCAAAAAAAAADVNCGRVRVAGAGVAHGTSSLPFLAIRSERAFAGVHVRAC